MRLSEIPFLDRYRQREAGIRDEGMDEMKQVSGVMTLSGLMQQQQEKQRAAQREQAFRSEVGALGPNPTQERLAQVGSKYLGPADLVKTQQASLDRKESNDARAQQFREGIGARLFQADQAAKDRLAQIAASGANQLQVEAYRAKEKEESDKRHAAAQQMLVRLTASLRPAPQPRNLQLTADAQGNQLIVVPDGTTRPLTTQDGTGVRKPVMSDKPMTEFQGKAALYGTRSAQSDKVLKALEDKISTVGLAAGQAAGTLGNFALSSEQQRVSQAQRDFVNAVLRQESGAVISDAEFANAKKQYFPAPGDDANTVRQKRANRQLAIQGFARMSGPKGATDIQAIIESQLLPGQAAPAAKSVLDEADAILRGGR